MGQPIPDPPSPSASTRFFSIPELLHHTFNFLLPPDDLYLLDGPEHDLLSSPTTQLLSSHLASLLRISLVSRTWHATIFSSRSLLEGLYLLPSSPDDLSWTVPSTAPWRALKSQIEELRIGGPLPSPVPQPTIPVAEPVALDLAGPWRRQITGKHKQLYPSRPRLNPLLIRIPDLRAQFVTMYHAPRKDTYHVRMRVWRQDVQFLRHERASWREMQLSAPPMTRLALMGDTARRRRYVECETGVTVGMLVDGLAGVVDESDTINSISVETALINP